MAARVKDARASMEAYSEDCVALLAALREAGAAAEDAEREAGHQRQLAEQARADWQRKLKDRRQEVATI